MAIFVAQMILGSPQLLHVFQTSTLHKIETLLAEVLKWDPSDIRKLEHKKGVSWNSFEPLMYLYEPCIRFCMLGEVGKQLESICHLSFDILLNFAEVTVWEKEQVQVLIEQELLDFVVMAPWFVPSCSQERARRVVHQLSKLQSLQPPSLGSICKTKVAKLKLGLISKTDTVKSISQIYSKLF